MRYAILFLGFAILIHAGATVTTVSAPEAVCFTDAECEALFGEDEESDPQPMAMVEDI